MKTTYSLTEIETHCRKAARGSGLSWGLAEEAGKIARYLASYKIDGPKLLANYINWRESGVDADDIPHSDGDNWQTVGNEMCPIIAGSILSDRAELIEQKARTTFSNVAWPALMIPQLLRAAEATSKPMVLEWDDFRATASSNGIRFEGQNTMASTAQTVTCGGNTRKINGVTQSATIGFNVENSDWDALAASAHRTYAPASEESRLSGAGSGLNDND